MRASRVQIVALLIVALIFGAAQCLASCAADGGRSPAPPCHQHPAPSHQLAALCGHDFLVPDSHRLSGGHAAAVAFHPPTVRTAPSFIVPLNSWVPTDSPPGLSS